MKKSTKSVFAMVISKSEGATLATLARAINLIVKRKRKFDRSASS